MRVVMWRSSVKLNGCCNTLRRVIAHKHRADITEAASVTRRSGSVQMKLLVRCEVLAASGSKEDGRLSLHGSICSLTHLQQSVLKSVLKQRSSPNFIIFLRMMSGSSSD